MKRGMEQFVKAVILGLILIFVAGFLYFLLSGKLAVLVRFIKYKILYGGA